MVSERRSTQEAAQQLGISFKQLETKLVAEVGRMEVARAPEVRQLRAQLKRAEQELDILKKVLAIFAQPAL